ncbi:MAG: type IV pilus secretin PilQ [Proteobacteria bacterium]|nr:type IV pilus secretin PilQ [Pseudomonadota bacterium]
MAFETYQNRQTHRVRSWRCRGLSVSFLTLLISIFLSSVAFVAAPSITAAASSIKAEIEADKRLFSMEIRDGEISDVLRALASQSGFNIILGDGVTGTVTLSFTDITFKNALEIIIEANGLKYTIKNNVFWVGKEVDHSLDMTTRVVRLNYANPAEMAERLKSTLSASGAVEFDTRTSSVIIRDFAENIAKAEELIGLMDIQASQVVIEARIVEASSNFTKELGVQWGGEYSSSGDTITGSSQLPDSDGGRNFAVNMPSTNANAGLGIIVGSLSNSLTLDIEISAAESKGELKIISSPKISTLHNKTAMIHSGLTFRVKLSQAATGTTTGETTAGLEEIKTGIDLMVTPQISSDGFVMLAIETNKSDPDYTHTVDGIPGVSEKSASTHVLVKDGETVVIGGLYKSINSDDTKAVPGLSKIPLLGYLFKSSALNEQHEELLVFITPRIIKQKEQHR